MTNRQLNSKIKQLGSEFWALTFESRHEQAYYDNLQKVQPGMGITTFQNLLALNGITSACTKRRLESMFLTVGHNTRGVQILTK